MTLPIHSVKRVTDANRRHQIITIFLTLITIAAALAVALSGMQLAALRKKQAGPEISQANQPPTAETLEMNKKMIAAIKELRAEIASEKKKSETLTAEISKLQKQLAASKPALPQQPSPVPQQPEPSPDTPAMTQPQPIPVPSPEAPAATTPQPETPAGEVPTQTDSQIKTTPVPSPQPKAPEPATPQVAPAKPQPETQAVPAQPAEVTSPVPPTAPATPPKESSEKANESSPQGTPSPQPAPKQPEATRPVQGKIEAAPVQAPQPDETSLTEETLESTTEEKPLSNQQ